MTEKSIPHSGKTTGDAGPYSSSDWARLWRTLYSGILRDDASVIPNTGNGVDDPLWVEQTSPATTQVQVNIGNALVKGYWYQTDAIVNVQISPNTDASGDDRIDLIILRLDVTNQDVRIEILEGTVAPVPVAPSTTQNATIWEVPIAQIAVANSFVTIVDANITNTVRSWFALLDPKIGGTGKAQYDWTHREMLEGGSDLQLSSGVHSMAVFRISGNCTAKASGSWLPVEVGGSGSQDIINDPDGLISSLASDGVVLTYPGLYKCSFYWGQLADNGAGIEIIFRLANNTQATAGNAIWSLYNTATTDNVTGFGIDVIEADASDKIRWEGYSNLTWQITDRTGGAAGATINGEKTVSFVMTIERIAQGA